MAVKNKEMVEMIQGIRTQSVILYFTSQDCQVCKVLKPKVEQMVDTRFPRMNLHFIDAREERQTAAYFQVFTVPAILVFFEGKEYIRKSRNFSLLELEKEILRPYQLLFEE